MTKLQWDAVGERFYETGTKHGVLFPKNTDGSYAKGVAWNGLTGVTESPSGAEETKLWADDMKYLSLRSAEEFGATVEAYTYPDEFAECDGSAALGQGVYIGQQVRKGFSMSYQTVLGNDAAGDSYGYKLHIIYNATVTPSEKSYSTINDSPEAITFSWELSTSPISFGDNHRPSAYLTIDSSKCDPDILAQIEDKLYGTENSESALPTPEWILGLFEYEVVTNPTGNPSTQGWYELVEGEYVLTEDTTVDESKTYYRKTTD